MKTPFITVALLLTALTGCAADAASDADGASVSEDALSSSHYPAFKPDIATLKQNPRNPVLKNATLVTITYPGDSNRERLEAFSDGLGRSRFWSTAVSEYGVGPTRSDASLHVHLDASDLPRVSRGKVLDTDVVDFVVGHAKSEGSGWPARERETLYIIYVPKSVALTTGDGSVGACDSYMGFHDESVSGKDHLLYTIVYEACGNGTLDEVTDTASHEIAEAATDPWTSQDATLALSGFDDDHLAWSLFNEKAEENGDACEFYDDANVTLGGDFPFRVQSLWSNKAALAGSNPCVPAAPFEAASPAYFNVTPLDMKNVSLVVAQRGKKTSTVASVTTKGFRVDSRTNRVDFKVGFYSDKDTGGAFTLSAIEGAVWSKSREHRLDITFGPDGARSLDGKNGTKADVHVAFDPTKTGALDGDAILITLVSSKDGMPKHYMPILIGIPRANAHGS